MQIKVENDSVNIKLYTELKYDFIIFPNIEKTSLSIEANNKNKSFTSLLNLFQ